MVRTDADRHPHVVFSIRHEPTAGEDGRIAYHYGWFDGSAWHVGWMAHAGGARYPHEADYTGLVAIDPADPWRVFVSTNVDPVTGQPLVSRDDGRQHHELFRGHTTDGGATWCWSALTADSTADNLRPIVPTWDSEHTALLWLRGDHTTYQRYDLAVVGLFGDPTLWAGEPTCETGS